MGNKTEFIPGQYLDLQEIHKLHKASILAGAAYTDFAGFAIKALEKNSGKPLNNEHEIEFMQDAIDNSDGWSPEKRDKFIERYKVIHSANGPQGIRATLFEDKKTGQKTLAFAGTEFDFTTGFVKDMVTNMTLIIAGYTSMGHVSKGYFNKLIEEGLISKDSPIQIVGHSQGGLYVQSITNAFPDYISEGIMFNAPGPGHPVERLAKNMGLVSEYRYNPKITQVETIQGIPGVSGFGRPYAGRVIQLLHPSSIAVYTHSLSQLKQALLNEIQRNEDAHLNVRGTAYVHFGDVNIYGSIEDRFKKAFNSNTKETTSNVITDTDTIPIPYLLGNESKAEEKKKSKDKLLVDAIDKLLHKSEELEDKEVSDILDLIAGKETSHTKENNIQTYHSDLIDAVSAQGMYELANSLKIFNQLTSDLLEKKITQMKSKATHRHNYDPLAEIEQKEIQKAKLAQVKNAQEKTYYVKRGDNLTNIARKKNVTIETIIRNNPELRDNPNHIVEGQALQLDEINPEFTYETKTLTGKKGHFFDKVIKRKKQSAELMMKKVVDHFVDKARSGKLLPQHKESLAKIYGYLTQKDYHPNSWQKKAFDKVFTHIVKKGENVTEIAKRYDTPIRRVLKLNPGLQNNPNFILPGQKIYVLKHRGRITRNGVTRNCTFSKSHIVKRGDSLSKIARRYHINPNTLLRLNPKLKANPNLILVGQKINLYGGKAIFTPNKKTHKVEFGQTLQRFASEHKTTLTHLLRHNRMLRDNKDLMSTGQMLNIPVGRVKKVYPAKWKTHTVRSGENLTKIAKMNGVSVESLLKYNPKLKINPDLILTGQKIMIVKKLKQITGYDPFRPSNQQYRPAFRKQKRNRGRLYYVRPKKSSLADDALNDELNLPIKFRMFPKGF